jgi:tetratricopeptide (TPR) repeat protein
MMKSIVSLLLALALPLAAADAIAYKEALERGKASLTQQKYSEALKHLQDAATADPSRHEPYFLLAVVSYRTGDLKTAETFANTALKKAPEAEKKTVQELIKVIDEKRDFTKLVAAGDEALENGLMAKAADMYRNAYLLFPMQGEIGLKSAELFHRRLGRLLDAAVLWQKILVSGDKQSAATAREKLVERSSDLQSLFDVQMSQIEEFKKRGNPAPLLILTEAFPQRPEPHLHLASLFATKNEVEKVVVHLAAANKAGLQAFPQNDEFVSLLGDTPSGRQFESFLRDAYGNDVAATMKGRWKKDEARRMEVKRVEEEKRRKEEQRMADLRRKEEDKRRAEELKQEIRRQMTKNGVFIPSWSGLGFEPGSLKINGSLAFFGPAAKAGLRPGDEVQSINGRQFASSSEAFDMIRNSPYGTKLEIQFRRPSVGKSFKTTLETVAKTEETLINSHGLDWDLPLNVPFETIKPLLPKFGKFGPKLSEKLDQELQMTLYYPKAINFSPSYKGDRRPFENQGVIVKDGLYGVYTKNGKVTGYVGAVHSFQYKSDGTYNYDPKALTEALASAKEVIKGYEDYFGFAPKVEELNTQSRNREEKLYTWHRGQRAVSLHYVYYAGGYKWTTFELPSVFLALRVLHLEN